MPYTESTLSAEEIAAHQRGNPILIATNVLEFPNLTPIWKTTGVYAGGTDYTDLVDFPTWRGYDRQTNAITRPLDISEQTDIYYVTSLIPSATRYLDSVCILNHNFDDLSPMTISVQIADDDAFLNTGGNRLNTIATWNNPTSPARLKSTNLLNGEGIALYARYSNVSNLRVHFYKAGGFGDTPPAFSEIIVGQRRAFDRNPNDPWDPYLTESDFDEIVADGGHRTRYTNSKGRAKFDFEVTVTQPATYDLTSALRNWWKESDYGTKPFLFDVSPQTTGGMFYVYSQDEAFTLPPDGPFIANPRFRFIESTPYVSREV